MSTGLMKNLAAPLLVAAAVVDGVQMQPAGFVIAVLVFFVRDPRAALISLIAIPLSLSGALLVLWLSGGTLNTLFLAGLVIALGEVVDDAIIDVENIHRRLSALPARPTLKAAMRVVLSASLEVRSAIIFASLIVLVFMLILAAVPQLFATHDPADTNAGARLQNYYLGPKDTFLCPTTVEDSVISGKRVVEGSITEPFGTDQLQRDVFSRTIYGARWAIYIGLISVAISSFLSLAIGVSCGHFGGKYDATVQRFVDAIMALPALVVLLALPQMIGKWDIDGPLPLDQARITFFKLALVLGILGGAGGSRVIRSAVIGVRSAQYLEAARVIGKKSKEIAEILGFEGRAELIHRDDMALER